MERGSNEQTRPQNGDVPHPPKRDGVSCWRDLMPKLRRWERVALSFISKPWPMQCEARTRAGGSCKAPALPNGRCKLHGGRSTGPLSEAGRERIAAAQRKRWRRWRSEAASAHHRERTTPTHHPNAGRPSGCDKPE